MRMFIATLALFVAVSVTRADDWAKFEGEWKPIGMELGGQKFNASQMKGITLILTKEKYELITPQGSDKGETKVDEKKKPKELDITGKEGPNKDKLILAIYEFDGEMLKVCYALDGKARPTDFKTTKENGYFLAVYAKEKK